MANINMHKCCIQGCDEYDSKEMLDYPKSYFKTWRWGLDGKHYCEEHYNKILASRKGQTTFDGVFM